jgi:hypothetical protein
MNKDGRCLLKLFGMPMVIEPDENGQIFVLVKRIEM